MPKDVVPRKVEINGQPGVVLYVADRPYSVLGFRFSAGRIEEIFSVLNPEKLRSLGRTYFKKSPEPNSTWKRVQGQ
jgi:hypothetical protein